VFVEAQKIVSTFVLTVALAVVLEYVLAFDLNFELMFALWFGMLCFQLFEMLVMVIPLLDVFGFELVELLLMLALVLFGVLLCSME